MTPQELAEELKKVRDAQQSTHAGLDLEDAIMGAWQTETDLKLLLEMLCDGPASLRDDDIANAVLGIMTMHSFRMEKVWACFSKTLNEKVIEWPPL